MSKDKFLEFMTYRHFTRMNLTMKWWSKNNFMLGYNWKSKSYYSPEEIWKSGNRQALKDLIKLVYEINVNI